MYPARSFAEPTMRNMEAIFEETLTAFAPACLLRVWVLSFALGAASVIPAHAQALTLELSKVVEGDVNWDWTQARTAYVPGQSPLWLTMMSRTAKVGAHGYLDVFLSVSRDFGMMWSSPEVIPSLRRAPQTDGYEVVAGDLWPTYHPMTRTILVTGKTSISPTNGRGLSMTVSHSAVTTPSSTG